MASLLITHGIREGDYHAIPDESIVTVGRDDTCTIQILDRSISRAHLQITREDKTGGHLAGDYQSANGVFINRSKIVGTVQLKDGDQILLGETSLVYLSNDHPDSKTAMDEYRKRDEWKRSTLMHDD